MRVLPFVLIFAALSGRPALAQPNSTPAITSPIRYSRDLPKSVSRLMPRGAKSLFWGAFRPMETGELMGIHLLALRPKKDLAKNTEAEATYHFALDVFASQRQGWRRLNRIPVIYEASMWGPVTVDTCLYWLNQREKTAPVLVFGVMTPKGTPTFMGSPVGDGVFVTFPQGWAKTAHVDTFRFGAASYGSESYHVEIGQEGQLQIKTSLNEPSEATEMLYRWNERKFAFVPGTRKVLPLQP